MCRSASIRTWVSSRTRGGRPTRVGARMTMPSWRCAGVRRVRRSWAAAAVWGPSTSPPLAASARPRRARVRRPAPRAPARRPLGRNRGPPDRLAAPCPQPWRDDRGRAPLPLPFPDLSCRLRRLRPDPGQLPGLAPPVPRAVGAGRRCLDVGCGSGLLDRPARAQRRGPRPRDRPRRGAVANTLTNAFRNGVADRVTAATVDLYPWVPEERYDVVVASLYQTARRPVRQV